MTYTPPINIPQKNNNYNYQISNDVLHPPQINNSKKRDATYRFSNIIENLSNTTIEQDKYKNFSYKNRYY